MQLEQDLEHFMSLVSFLTLDLLLLEYPGKYGPSYTRLDVFPGFFQLDNKLAKLSSPVVWLYYFRGRR